MWCVDGVSRRVRREEVVKAGVGTVLKEWREPGYLVDFVVICKWSVSIGRFCEEEKCCGKCD